MSEITKIKGPLGTHYLPGPSRSGSVSLKTKERVYRVDR